MPFSDEKFRAQNLFCNPTDYEWGYITSVREEILAKD
jgi:hypothetical protein